MLRLIYTQLYNNKKEEYRVRNQIWIVYDIRISIFNTFKDYYLINLLLYVHVTCENALSVSNILITL